MCRVADYGKAKPNKDRSSKVPDLRRYGGQGHQPCTAVAFLLVDSEIDAISIHPNLGGVYEGKPEIPGRGKDNKGNSGQPKEKHEHETSDHYGIAEKIKRLFLSSCAAVLGHGGILAVAAKMKVNRDTVAAGKKELQEIKQERNADEKAPHPENRIRKIGGGRKNIAEIDENFRKDLDFLIEPQTSQIKTSYRTLTIQ